MIYDRYDILTYTLSLSPPPQLTLVVSTFFGVCYFFVFRTFSIPEMPKDEEEDTDADGVSKTKTDTNLSLKERLKLTLSLWRWGVPLIVG